VAAIDSILSIMVDQGANELRLGTGKAPAIFRDGTRKKLSIAQTTAETLRHLLGPILTREREAALWSAGRAEFPYDSARLGAFWVMLAGREPALRAAGQGADFDVTFLRRGAPATARPEGDKSPSASPPGTLDGPGAQGAPHRLGEPSAPHGLEEPSAPPLLQSTLLSLPDEAVGAARAAMAAMPAANAMDNGLRLTTLSSGVGEAPAATAAGSTGLAHWPAAAPAPTATAACPAKPRSDRATYGPAGGEAHERGLTLADPGAALMRLLAQAAALRASDVHLRSGESPSLRVDGRLRLLGEEPAVDVLRLLGGWLTPAAAERVRAGGSADLGADVASVGRIRINLYRSAGQLCAALRLLPPVAPSIVELNMPIPIDDLVDLPHGLVIVCGPTGSGKSSTLAALAQEVLRRRSVMLLSLEDPVEFLLQPGPKGSLVRQRQIGADVRDFPTGLRDALREDPNVLLMGEMRDPESIGLTLTAAETGHLVLTSLHSRSAASAIARMTDSYPPERQQQIRIQIADSLRAVIAQRLLPRAAGKGRLPAVEVLRVNHSVANLIREGRTAQIETALQAGRKEGMLPLERCLADLVRAGHVTLEAARAEANDQVTLSAYLQS
jgi:twitching motility protein PilT